MAHSLIVVVCVIGAAFCGWFVFLENKTQRWFSFPILAVSAHGLMLVGMAAHFVAPETFGMGFMQLLALLLSVPLWFHGPAKLLQKLGDPNK